MKKIITIVIIVLIATFCVSCTDARQAKIGGYGDNFRVDLINCDGTITHSWISTGKVLSEETSDGYYFFDANSKELIEVTGNLIITRLSSTPPKTTIQ